MTNSYDDVEEFLQLIGRNFGTIIIYFLVICVTLRLIKWLSHRLQSGSVREKILVSQLESAAADRFGKATTRAPERGQILELHPLAQGYYALEYYSMFDVYVTLGINLTNIVITSVPVLLVFCFDYYYFKNGLLIRECFRGAVENHGKEPWMIPLVGPLCVLYNFSVVVVLNTQVLLSCIHEISRAVVSSLAIISSLAFGTDYLEYLGNMSVRSGWRMEVINSYRQNWCCGPRMVDLRRCLDVPWYYFILRAIPWYRRTVQVDYRGLLADMFVLSDDQSRDKLSVEEERLLQHDEWARECREEKRKRQEANARLERGRKKETTPLMIQPTRSSSNSSVTRRRRSTSIQRQKTEKTIEAKANSKASKTKAAGVCEWGSEKERYAALFL